MQHGGTLAGMLLASAAGRRVGGLRLGSLKAWTVGGCIASAVALLGLVAAGRMAPSWPLQANVFLLGVANGAFSIAAIGAMMSLAGAGATQREGTRMGLWGAAQAIGFALGGLLGAAASDVARQVFSQTGHAYGAVFFIESALFLVAAILAARVRSPALALAAPNPAATKRSPTPPSAVATATAGWSTGAQS